MSIQISNLVVVFLCW